MFFQKEVFGSLYIANRLCLDRALRLDAATMLVKPIGSTLLRTRSVTLLGGTCAMGRNIAGVSRPTHLLKGISPLFVRDYSDDSPQGLCSGGAPKDRICRPYRILSGEILFCESFIHNGDGFGLQLIVHVEAPPCSAVGFPRVEKYRGEIDITPES